jgi:hypothetical protein
LLRDKNGRHLKGFAVEMRGMYIDMDLAWKHRISHLIVDSDFVVLVDIVLEGCSINGNTPILIKRIRDFLSSRKFILDNLVILPTNTHITSFLSIFINWQIDEKLVHFICRYLLSYSHHVHKW